MFPLAEQRSKKGPLINVIWSQPIIFTEIEDKADRVR